MEKEQKKQWTSENVESTDPDSREAKKRFNAGGNDSDYDGGHPGDAVAKKHKPNEKLREHSTGNSYNSGGNDSDYDGGHPEDVKPESEGRIGYKNKK